MEGACGKILITEDPSVVIKKVHRRNRAQQRTSSLRAEEQARMQKWARGLCASLKLPLLFVPRAWDAEKYQYKMEKIDVSHPLLEPRTHPVLADLKIFFAKAKQESIFPADYELYIQPDGRVAMVDFDKFAIWNADGSVQFSWGLTMTTEQVEESLKIFLGQ
jgi:hypothetical protein